MTQCGQVQISEAPGEFVAAVPALLGFVPVESIVVATIIAESRAVESVFRMELPVPGEVSNVAHQLRTVVRNQVADAVDLLIVGGNANHSDDLPYRDLIDELTRLLHGHDISVGHALWVERIAHGLPWRSYVDPDGTGQIAFTMDTGPTIYASRDELAAQLAADPRPLLSRRAKLLRALPAVRPDQAIALVREIVDQMETSGADRRVVDDDTLVRLGQALTHAGVREASLKLVLTERARAAAVERLCALLTRALPRSVVAYPASLLAVCVFLRGEGALAHVACDIALRADPNVRLGKIVRGFLNHGMRPDQFWKVLTSAVEQG